MSEEDKFCALARTMNRMVGEYGRLGVFPHELYHMLLEWQVATLCALAGPLGTAQLLLQVADNLAGQSRVPPEGPTCH